MQGPTLVILAAGVGSRYGGPKQIDRVGPGGATLLDYAAYDARRAGFARLVLVVRQGMEADVREAVGDRIARRFPVDYAVQDRALPPGFVPPPGRSKPWGTGHAVLAAAPFLDGTFAVINADDFYGAGAYAVAAGACHDADRTGDYAIVGYRLARTLSDHGAVARGVTRTEGRRLVWLDEVRGVERTPEGIVGTFPDGVRTLTGAEIASMNCWVFAPSIFGLLEDSFAAFLKRHGADPKAESALPEAINVLVQGSRVKVNVIDAPGPWFGMTHIADRPKVQAGLQALVDQGVYPTPLWQ